jgi:hypothetical protein
MRHGNLYFNDSNKSFTNKHNIVPCLHRNVIPTLCETCFMPATPRLCRHPWFFPTSSLCTVARIPLIHLIIIYSRNVIVVVVQAESCTIMLMLHKEKERIELPTTGDFRLEY